MTLFMTLTLIAMGLLTSVHGDSEYCMELSDCVLNRIQGNISDFPVTELERKAMCKIYDNIWDCANAWKVNCLTQKQQVVVTEQLHHIDHVAYLMCEQPRFYRDEYLKEGKSFKSARDKMRLCTEAFQKTAEHFTTPEMSTTNMKLNLCCSWYNYKSCMIRSCSSSCTTAASTILRRILHRLSKYTFNDQCSEINLDKNCIIPLVGR